MTRENRSTASRTAQLISSLRNGGFIACASDRGDGGTCGSALGVDVDRSSSPGLQDPRGETASEDAFQDGLRRGIGGSAAPTRPPWTETRIGVFPIGEYS